MKKSILFFLLFFLSVFLINNLKAQSCRNRNKNLKIQISPINRVFSEMDSALFKVTFINNTDSVLHIIKYPRLCVNRFFDMYPTYHNEDIYTFILKKHNNKGYSPYDFYWSDPIGVNENYVNTTGLDSNLREQKISIEPGSSATLLLDLIPLKSLMPSGVYKARIAFFLNNERPFVLIKSNWTKFILVK